MLRRQMRGVVLERRWASCHPSWRLPGVADHSAAHRLVSGGAAPVAQRCCGHGCERHRGQWRLSAHVDPAVCAHSDGPHTEAVMCGHSAADHTALERGWAGVETRRGRALPTIDLSLAPPCSAHRIAQTTRGGGEQHKPRHHRAASPQHIPTSRIHPSPLRPAGSAAVTPQLTGLLLVHCSSLDHVDSLLLSPLPLPLPRPRPPRPLLFLCVRRSCVAQHGRGDGCGRCPPRSDSG